MSQINKRHVQIWTPLTPRQMCMNIHDQQSGLSALGDDSNQSCRPPLLLHTRRLSNKHLAGTSLQGSSSCPVKELLPTPTCINVCLPKCLFAFTQTKAKCNVSSTMLNYCSELSSFPHDVDNLLKYSLKNDGNYQSTSAENYNSKLIFQLLLIM